MVVIEILVVVVVVVVSMLQYLKLLCIFSRVWTCFEHCMVKSPDVLRDRHMDQIIMCSIYILSKVMVGRCTCGPGGWWGIILILISVGTQYGSDVPGDDASIQTPTTS